MKVPSPRASNGRTARARLAMLTLAFTLMSCANASQLARRSEHARVSGDPERAYALALQAREKDANAQATRAAIDEAAWALYQRSRDAIRSRAANGDTFEAANRVVDLDRLRLRFAHDGVPAPQDPEFEPQEARIRQAGADWFYHLGVQSLKDDHPKDAWRQFLSVRDLIQRYPDLDRMIARAWQEAVTPVAILPFADQAGMPESSVELAREIHDQLAKRIDGPRFTFTRLVDPQQVMGRVSVAEASQLDRGRAIAIGRALGARRVVWGRIWNLRSDTDNDRWTENVWHEVARKDTGGKETKVWVSVPFHAVSRQRTVYVDAEFEVLDCDQGDLLDRRNWTWEATARTAFTDSRLDGDSDDYRLCPPTFERNRADALGEHWKHAFGPWSLSQFVDQSRRNTSRSEYRSSYAAEFEPEYGHDRIYLDDLPPVVDLAHIALGRAWKPVFDSLALLDPK